MTKDLNYIIVKNFKDVNWIIYLAKFNNNK